MLKIVKMELYLSHFLFHLSFLRPAAQQQCNTADSRFFMQRFSNSILCIYCSCSLSLSCVSLQKLFPISYSILLFYSPVRSPFLSASPPPPPSLFYFATSPQPCTFLPPSSWRIGSCCNLPGPTLSIALNNVERARFIPPAMKPSLQFRTLFGIVTALLLANSQSGGSCEMQRLRAARCVILMDCA